MGVQVIIQTAKKGLRPTIPENCPVSLSDLMNQCWQPEASNRLDCKQILDKLDTIQSEYAANNDSWDSLLSSNTKLIILF